MDTLIRYSEIKNILDENMDNDNNINKNKFFQMLVQLCEYDEMRNISNYIFNSIDNDYLPPIFSKIFKIFEKIKIKFHKKLFKNIIKIIISINI